MHPSKCFDFASLIMPRAKSKNENTRPCNFFLKGNDKNKKKNVPSDDNCFKDQPKNRGFCFESELKSKENKPTISTTVIVPCYPHLQSIPKKLNHDCLCNLST